MKEQKYAPLQLVDDVNTNFCIQYELPYNKDVVGLFESESYLNRGIRKYIYNAIMNSKVAVGKTDLEIKAILENEYRGWLKENSTMHMIWYLANSWRKQKNVIVINKRLAERVMETDDSIIPTEVIEKLCHKSLYIDLNGKDGCFNYNGVDIGGILVSVDKGITAENVEYKSMTLCILDGKNKMRCVAFNLDKLTGTIKDTLNEVFNKSKEPVYCELKETTELTLKLLLYYISINADVVENYEQSLIHRASEEIRDKFREIRKWDVGKNYKETEDKPHWNFTKYSDKSYSGDVEWVG